MAMGTLMLASLLAAPVMIGPACWAMHRKRRG